MNQKVIVIYNLNGSKTIQVAEVKSMDPLKVRELVQTCKANAKQELESQENEKKAIVEDYNAKVESLNKEISDLGIYQRTQVEHTRVCKMMCWLMLI